VPTATCQATRQNTESTSQDRY